MEHRKQDLRGMVRNPDHATSVQAAASVEPKLSKLQREVLEAIRNNPGCCDSDLENLPQFAHYSYSTIRKRRTELYQKGRIEIVGTKRIPNGRSQNTYRIAGKTGENFEIPL